MEQELDPLFGDSPAEVALSEAPLVRVLAQISFDPILILRNEDTVAPFQNKIRSAYSKMSHETLRLNPFVGDDAEARTEVIWRFHSADAAWRVSVSPTFLALETGKYVSRADLLARVRVLVTALKATVGELHVGRIGLRYVDQVKAPELDSLRDMVRPEMLGITNSPLHSKVRHAVTETYCDTAEGGIIARWGMLPPQGSHDPNVVAPVPEASWFLDIDAFTPPGDLEGDMDADAICRTAEALAMRSYAFFRWAVTPKFLEIYGGQQS